MARSIRTIKREILEDEKAAGLSSEAWRLWVSMWLLADDYGRLRANPGWLHSQTFWAAPLPVDCEELLKELADPKRALIIRYRVGGQEYAAISNWAKHQRLDSCGKSNIPVPENADRLPEVSNLDDSRGEVAANRGEPRRPLALATEVGAGIGRGVGEGKDLSRAREDRVGETDPLLDASRRGSKFGVIWNRIANISCGDVFFCGEVMEEIAKTAELRKQDPWEYAEKLIRSFVALREHWQDGKRPCPQLSPKGMRDNLPRVIEWMDGKKPAIGNERGHSSQPISRSGAHRPAEEVISEFMTPEQERAFDEVQRARK